MCKWLCEDVGHLEVGSNTGQFDVPTQALVAHEVIEFCDVFRSLVMHRVFRNLDGSRDELRGATAQPTGPA